MEESGLRAHHADEGIQKFGIEFMPHFRSKPFQQNFLEEKRNC